MQRKMEKMKMLGVTPRDGILNNIIRTQKGVRTPLNAFYILNGTGQAGEWRPRDEAIRSRA